MTTELQFDKVPAPIAALIARDARRNRRGFQQEMMLLLQEALVARVNARHSTSAEVDEILERFDEFFDLPQRGPSGRIDYKPLYLPE